MGDTNRRFDVDNSALNEPTANNGFLDLGVTGTGEVSTQDLHDYLTSDDSTVTSSADELEPIQEDDEPKVQPKSKKTASKEEVEEDAEEDKNQLNQKLNSYLTEDEDEDDEEVETPTSTKSKEKETKQDESDNVFGTLAKDLYSLGVFTPDSDEEDDEPITNAEQFLEKFNNDKIKQANQFINDFLGKFGEEYREAFESIYLKGVSPRDYFAAQERIESLKDLDLKDLGNQKKVFIEYHKRQGLSEEKINKKLERAMDMEILSEEVEDLHEILVEQESKQIQQMEVEKAAQEKQKHAEEMKYVQGIHNILQEKLKDKEFDGIPLTVKEAEETRDYMTTKKWKLPNGELLTDFDKDILELKHPDNYELRLKMGLLLKKKGDLSKIKQKAVSTKASELFSDTLIQAKTTKRNTGTYKTDNSGKSFFS